MDLETIIKSKVSPLIPGSRGWLKTRCMVCNDHQKGSPNFKGYRGNFLLQGNVIGYNCYNCDHKAKFDPDINTRLSKNMQEVFDSFNIPKEDYTKVLFELMKSDVNGKKQKIKKLHLEPKILEIPKHFYLLSEAEPTDKWAKIATHYLKNRLIDPNEHKFYLSTGEGEDGKKWQGRVIYTVYKDSKLVYYQGRSLIPNVIKKYESPTTEKFNLIYNYELIESYSNKPIFVVEGWFDAVLINGVAIFGKNLTEEQKAWLNKSPNEKIVIPDKFGDGMKMVESALDAGWSISLPDFGDCKDVTDAMIKYGKFYVIDSIMNNVKKGPAAGLLAKLYCE